MAQPTRGFAAGMAQRREPPDALDHSPTPPWATLFATPWGTQN